MTKEIILLGGGGHCRSCIDVIEQDGKYHIAGIVDIPEKLHQIILGYKIIASDDDLSILKKQYSNFLISVGQITSPAIRIKLFSQLKKMNVNIPTIISPFAYVSPHAILGEGTIVMHKAVVNAGSVIGSNCIINTKALIEHDVVVGDHTHISTGTLINGGVKIGECSFVGSGSVCIENSNIKKNSFIGCKKIYK